MCSIWKKSIFVSNWGGCTNQDVFFSFLAFPLLPWNVCLFLVWFPFYVLVWTLTSVPTPGCLSQTAVQHCDNAFVFPNLFMNILFFVSFFLFFPSRSGAPDVKPPRYGVYWFAFPCQPTRSQHFPSPEIILVDCAALIFPLLFSHILAYSFLLPVMLCHYSLNFCPSNPCPDHWLSYWNITFDLCSFSPR